MRLKSTLIIAFAMLAVPSLAAAGVGATFKIVPLVSDQDGKARNTDPALVNSWGLAEGQGSPLWVADNGADMSTVYDRVTGEKQPLNVNIPHGAPTGIAFVNSDITFNVSENGVSGRSVFLFDTESGAIEGWAPSVDTANAIIAVDNSGNSSVYKGLALDRQAQVIYAADFHNNSVETYDTGFARIDKFTDHNLPKRYAPFNVMVSHSNIYVAFAKRQRNGDDEVHGAGLGYIDVFDRGTGSIRTLVANGPLNAPWGMAFAPKNWGVLAGMLLVGNFGDGRINVFDPNTGASLGQLMGTNGQPLVIDGLWALDTDLPDAVTFSAGPNEESHGLVGLIRMAQ